MFSESRSRQQQLVLVAALCVCAMVALYGFIPYTYSQLTHITTVFGALWTMWMRFSDFQYGMLVPLLSAFVVYTRRQELAALPICGWWPGIVPVMLTLALFWAGYRVDNQYIGFFSLQLLIASLVLWMLGWRWLKALAFPLAFLAFTWPMPFLDNVITFPLRMIMANASVGLLNTLGFPAVQNGSGIVSAETIGHPAGALFQVDVADPCSGIRSLFALLMVSALYANFTLKSPWKRLALFLSAIPIALLGNIVRILLLTIGIMTLGTPVAIGTLEHPSWFHEGAGYVVFIVALCGMMLFGNLLSSSPAEWRRKWRAVNASSKPSSNESRARDTDTDLY
jgi:exosortase